MRRSARMHWTKASRCAAAPPVVIAATKPSIVRCPQAAWFSPRNLKGAPAAGAVGGFPVEPGGVLEAVVLGCTGRTVETPAPLRRRQRPAAAVGHPGVAALGVTVKDVGLVEDLWPAVGQKAGAGGLDLDHGT